MKDVLAIISRLSPAPSAVRWRSLAVFLLEASTLLLVQIRLVAAASNGHSSSPPSSTSLLYHSSFTLPPAFLSSSSRQSMQPQKNWHLPEEATTGVIYHHSPSALQFWRRADVDQKFIDNTEMILSEGCTEEDISKSDEEDSSPTTQDRIVECRGVDGAEGETVAANDDATANNFVDSDRASTDFADIINTIDNSIAAAAEMQRKRKSRWERLSSIPVFGAVLPGKPLFMRILPIRSSEIISRAVSEMPARNDSQGSMADIGGIDSISLAASNVNGYGHSKMIEGNPDSSDQQLIINGDGVEMVMNTTPPIELVEADAETNRRSRMRSFFRRNNVDEKTNTTCIGADHSSPVTPVEAMNAKLPTETINTSADRSPTNATVDAMNAMLPIETMDTVSQGDEQSKRRRFFFRRKSKPVEGDNSTAKKPMLSKEELTCPLVATSIEDVQRAVLIDKIQLRDVGFKFPTKGQGSELVLGRESNNTFEDLGSNATSMPGETCFMRDDPVLNSTLSSLLNCDANFSSSHRRGIELINQHPVLSVVRKRVESKSKPGEREKVEDPHHLALVIEGGGMRGAVSAGMAAALTTLDLLDAFDSIHGSSAGAIVGAYIVSRQLCTDVYTDIMPAAGSRFASKRRGAISFGVDWLDDVIQRKLMATSVDTEESASDEICTIPEDVDGDTLPGYCEEDVKPTNTVLEGAKYLYGGVKSSITKPLSYIPVRRFGRALRPALTALDFASSMRQYLSRRPGMNLTYVLDGIMDESHGLRPFDIDAFRANDKRQPLYIVASAVSNGGKGSMETISFNSRDGDYFGSDVQGRSHDSKSSNVEKVSLFRKLWNVVKYVPLSIFSGLSRRAKSLFAGDDGDLPVKDAYEAKMVPPGSTAFETFARRHKIRRNRPDEEKEKMYAPTGRINDGGKAGVYACLEASMLVPGAAGPPIQLIRSKNRKFVEQRSRFPMFWTRKELDRRKESNSHLCFDAFCYEPIPYRSAVEVANATHALVLRSRPDGCVVETRQHMYERAVGPIYFRKHGMNQVAKLFSSGGSQYRYAEDILTLNEGLAQGIAVGQNDTSKGVKVPPTTLYYGNDNSDSVVDIDTWKRAHLCPITLPYGTPELPTLSQDKDEVLKAVRNGYAAAFDILAPVAGLSFDHTVIHGDKVAQLLFPDSDDIEILKDEILNKPVKIKSSYIGEEEEEEDVKRRSFAAWITRKRESKKKLNDKIKLNPEGALARRARRRTDNFHETDQYVRDESNTLEWIETEALLASLPGFRGGRLDHIADNIRKKENASLPEEEVK